MEAVGQYTWQMLTALKHMKTCSILHADIKPDNILVSKELNKVTMPPGWNKNSAHFFKCAAYAGATTISAPAFSSRDHFSS